MAAAPTLAGVAAALCLSPSAAVPAAAAQVHPAVLDAIVSPAAIAEPAEGTALTSAQVSQRAAANALPATYKVRAGDTLSSIATRLYHDRAAWPVLYWRNDKKIHWADEIYAGEVLRVPARPARIPKAPSALSEAAPVSVPAQAAEPAAATATAATYNGGTFGACVIARESGGNPQIMNASGHYGLYQFSYSTWVAYGGNPADFGHASVAEQNQVFANALAAGGEDNWAPYDGC
ncbi:MAG TPA: transglycosylase family protein [Streptosporangiaceae bacterium]|nr:transglycosylase family protein [Streptosporangiaceae bacterium]